MKSDITGVGLVVPIDWRGASAKMALGIYFFLGLANRLLDWINHHLRRQMHPEPEGEERLRDVPRRDRESVLHGRLQGGLAR